MKDHLPALLNALNAAFELDKKIKKTADQNGLGRTVQRLFHSFEALGFQVLDPSGQPYDVTRTDMDASIVGDDLHALHICEVIKPVVYFKEQDKLELVQKGVVLVESRPPA